jgi:hypothetical protein
VSHFSYAFVSLLTPHANVARLSQHPTTSPTSSPTHSRRSPSCQTPTPIPIHLAPICMVALVERDTMVEWEEGPREESRHSKRRWERSRGWVSGESRVESTRAELTNCVEFIDYHYRGFIRGTLEGRWI